VSPEITAVTVAAALRERITTGDLAPGHRLPTQQDLSAEFGVNRTVVRQALGTLKTEGLVTMGRGAPATVAPPAQRPRAQHGPAPAGVLLVDRLRTALAAEHVTIDVFSLTTETLSNAFAAVLPDVQAGFLRPRSVSVRVLLPHPEAHLAFPRSVGARSTDDDPALTRLRAKMRTWALTLRDQVQGVADQQLVERVSIDMRAVSITPVHKLYLLNGTESLIGYYQLMEHSVEIGDRPREIYDSLGARTKLFRSSNGPDRRDEQDAAFVDESLLWFESLWSTITQPFTLG
jgi:DNA-binding transcriptional regulator YhcF (GntR family)